jgi:hypothetical protein
MLRVPTASDEMVTLPTPAVKVADPSGVVPFLNVIVPVGTPPVADFTEPLKITDWWNDAGFADEVTLVELAALMTFCNNATDPLAV